MNYKVVLLFLSICLAISCSTDTVSNDNGNSNGDNSNPTAANEQPVGTSANDLLSADTYSSLVIELAYVDGFKPTTSTINNMVSFLESRIHKPNGITIVEHEITSGSQSSLTLEEVIAIEEQNRTLYNTEDTIAVWAFFTNAESDSNSQNGVVLGTAYRNTSFVIYEGTIHELSNSTFEPNRTVLETTVINHEFGHLLGLTNLGTPLQSDHEDPSHPKHCNVEDCLMYWASETGSGIDNLIGMNAAPQLDAQCIADLQANGGK